jgi:hypothetical protein
MPTEFDNKSFYIELSESLFSVCVLQTEATSDNLPDSRNYPIQDDKGLALAALNLEMVS